MLKQQNGGYIKFNAHSSNVPTTWALIMLMLIIFWGLEKTRKKEIQEWGLLKTVVLISGNEHSQISLDYRCSKAEPPVFFGVDDEQIIELASNFEAIIKKLTVWKYYLRKGFRNN